MKVLLRIAQYDLVESIKNTSTEACNDDLSSNRLSSFIFKANKMYSLGFHFSDNFPIQCQCLFSRLDHSIWRGAFDELLATLVDDSSFFLLTSI